MHTSDRQIVHECLSGNPEAFAELVDRYKVRIFALVYAKVGQFQDAEDLTQDVFFNAYKKLSTLKRWDNFYAWLHSSAVNRCNDFHRAQFRQIDAAYVADQSDSHRADMDAHAKNLRNQRIHEALASLPEMHRQVLVLRYMAGLKSKEIAETLRVSPNTINQRLMRARAKLKTVLSEDLVSMMPTALADRKLSPGFTARVVELIRDAKIQTAPHKTGLPVGLSAAGGLILLVLSFSLPQNPIHPLRNWLGGPLPSKSQVTEDGKLPIDAEVTRVAILAADGTDGGFAPKPPTPESLAAISQTEQTDPPNEEITVTGIHLPDDFDIMWYADISPDGREMVYVSRRNESWTMQLATFPLVGLEAMAPNEQRRKVILQEEPSEADYFQPKWSPDGRWIAFYRQGAKSPEKDVDVCVVPVTGGEMRLLATTDSDRHPGGLSWSPDSAELAFVKWRGAAADIYIVSLDTGAVRPFTTDGKENTEPTWSPDGEWIAYSSKRGLWIDSLRVWRQPVRDGEATVNEGLHLIRPPIHSPDGKWVAYTNYLPDGKSGFIASRVNEQGELAGEPIFLKAARLQVSARPLQWTPDGKLIVLQEAYTEMTYAFSKKSGERRRLSSNPEFWFEGAQWQSDGNRLFLGSSKDRRPGVLDIETGRFTDLPIEIPEGMFFGQSTLSPDEKWVAFVRIHPKMSHKLVGGVPQVSAHLHIMPVGGGTSKQLAQTEFYGMNPRWSPDGQKIAFINANFAASAGFESKLCVASVSDSQVKTFTDTERCMGAAWSPDGTMLAYLRLKGKGQVLDLDFDETEVDIYLVPATGGESKRIAAPPNSPPEGEILLPWTPFGRLSWTPDGKRLTFKIGGQAWVMSIDGGEPKPMRRNYIPSSWSSDGASYLAIGRNGELQRVSLDGTTIDELPFRVPADARPLSMSPDGETILYRQVDSGTQCWSIDVSYLVNQ
ncbi:MAG: sigma-70 family RNA polymerase sigma factor [Candidatus Poribacteria bacterium]|nr:sigma-70 family RNA polymerase sigma factor [Candidatus Poribacteria bacterium]